MTEKEIEAKQFDQFYPTKVWLATIVMLAPVIIVIIELYRDANYLANNDNLKVLLLFIVFGIFFSLPALALTYISFSILANKNSSEYLIRILCAVVALLCTFMIFWFINGTAATKLALIYSTSVVIASFLFKVKHRTALPTTLHCSNGG